MKHTLLGIIALLAACGGGTSKSPIVPASHTITGALTAPYCWQGYDIVAASVQVRDESNRLIGTGTTSDVLQAAIEKGSCRVTFSVSVPDAQFYSLKIGAHEGPAFSKAELTAKGWNVALNFD